MRCFLNFLFNLTNYSFSFEKFANLELIANFFEMILMFIQLMMLNHFTLEFERELIQNLIYAYQILVIDNPLPQVLLFEHIKTIAYHYLMLFYAHNYFSSFKFKIYM